MKAIAFFPATWNLAETTRTIEVAKACRGLFDISFAGYGGQFEELIQNEGFRLVRLEPRLTPEKIEYLYKVDQGARIGTFFSLEETRARIENEVTLMRKLQPLAAVTGFNTTVTISSRVSRVPLVWLTQSTWDVYAMIDQGLGSYMDDFARPLISLLPDTALKWMTKQAFALYGRIVLRPLNAVAREHSLQEFNDTRELWEGDYNLLAEPPDFSGLKDVPDTYRYIGPLIANLRKPVSEHVRDFATKDSGDSRILAFTIDDGLVSATVRGKVNPYYGVFEEPRYQTRIRMTPIPPNDWAEVVAHLGSNATLVAKLLMHEMPDNIDAAFASMRLQLLPASRKDFALTDCSCPDDANPCKHIAGVYYRLARQLDRDPFLLFELRGLSRGRLKEALRATPLGKALAPLAEEQPAPIRAAESSYTRPRAAPSTPNYRSFWHGAKRLPDEIEPATPPAVPAILVKKVGDFPPFWDRDTSFVAVMEELYLRLRENNKDAL